VESCWGQAAAPSGGIGALERFRLALVSDQDVAVPVSELHDPVSLQSVRKLSMTRNCCKQTGQLTCKLSKLQAAC
jgi:hypothetical protein